MMQRIRYFTCCNNCSKSSCWLSIPLLKLRLKLREGGGGALHIVWVQGRAIRKGIDLLDIGIENGINFHNFRNGTDFQDFGTKCS